MTAGDAVGSIDLRAPRFASDLHLCAAQPRTAERFFRMAAACHGGELLILGDLFEYWAGDDESAGGIGAQVATALRSAAGRGTTIYLMQGNRDLLLGRAFAQAAGATLLADPCRVVLAGVPTLLSHGDAYCTRDRAYMAFRRVSRIGAVQRMFLRQPIERRRAWIGEIRQRSEAGKKTMAADIMDVVPRAIERALRGAGALRMIHGHTHRPAFHRFLLDGREAERWVLPDWDFDAPAPRGGYLQLSDGRPEFVSP